MWIGSPMILIVIGPMLPELHPIKSAKSSFVRPYFVVRPVASINARFGYARDADLPPPSREPVRGSPLPSGTTPGPQLAALRQGRYLQRKLVCPIR
jgi:hypothetical protein